jgi:predicted metallopeptidase
MPLEYYDAPDVKRLVSEIVEALGLFHIVPQFLFCVRSRGSASKRTIARIHGLGRIWQETISLPTYYVIEVISERYDRLNEEDKEKTVIHELLHIPSGFTGGFRPHRGYIDHEIVENLHRTFKKQQTTKKQVLNDNQK